MENKKIIDAHGHEVTPSDNLFHLCQENTRIIDEKFDTKPTTFAKDALKRFRKNRSSVIASYILFAILFCAFVMPFLLPANITEARVVERELLPKLFDAGTGFWDGTTTYNKQVYDTVNQKPASDDFKVNAVSNLRISQEGEYFITNMNVPHAYGGYYIIANDGTLFPTGTTHDELVANAARFSSFASVTFVQANNMKITLTTLGDEIVYDDLPREKGDYRVFIEYVSARDTGGNPTAYDRIYLSDWLSTYGVKSFDVTQALVENSLDSIEGKVVLELLPKVEMRSILAIHTLIVESNSEDDVAKLSIPDANKLFGMQRQSNGSFPVGYWQCTGQFTIYKANVIYCWFTYDTYEAAYGDYTNNGFGSTKLRQYIDKGWCEYDFKVGPSSLKILDDKCPVREVYSQKESKEFPGTYTMSARISYYREVGYSKPPKFIFGTNANGYDIVKLSFKGLQLSCILAISVSFICLGFGLVWGAVSGYFGGNIDLAMERFCEILGGVPWICVMTLVKLHTKEPNLGTLAFALCLTGWMGIAGRTRTQFYRFKGREYVLASRTLGASDARLIFKHILPNSLGTIVTSSVLMIPSVIFSESVLAYLGIFKGSNSFGNILANNQSYLSTRPLLIVFPSIIIALLMISFNLFGNGLRDALNPSLKGSD